MSAPEPTTAEGLAEKVAREIVRWRAGRDAWDELDPAEQTRTELEADTCLRFVRAAGLAVVELPEPDRLSDGDLLWEGDSHDVRIGPGLPRLPGAVSISVERGQDVITTGEARGLAGMLLAAAAWAERQGGDPR